MTSHQVDEGIGVATECAVVPPRGQQQNGRLHGAEYEAQRHRARRADGEQLTGRAGQ
ncbi:hypothetical protein [Streptomyces sp. NPDC057689]|uniref:hypothetical protein n=1 Tax=Streptomyces sp. NPDC057689 TaxID=3346213 RepID=UPI0036A6BBC5